MPIELEYSPILDGKKALVVVIVNEGPIACGCAEAMHRAAAEAGS